LLIGIPTFFRSPLAQGAFVKMKRGQFSGICHGNRGLQAPSPCDEVPTLRPAAAMLGLGLGRVGRSAHGIGSGSIAYASKR
jgi:hypothetical protein